MAPALAAAHTALDREADCCYHNVDALFHPARLELRIGLCMNPTRPIQPQSDAPGGPVIPALNLIPAMNHLPSHSRHLLGTKRLRSFLRWSVQTMDEEDEMPACTLAIQELKAQRPLADLFSDGSPHGFSLRIEKVCINTFRIEFGCQAGPAAGNGGQWEVVFTRAGEVAAGRLVSRWLT